MGREVSASDHVELKAFSASFSKLDAEAIYRLLPFSKGDGYGYLDQKTRKIIVQPCATELIIPKRKSGKQVLGSIPNKNDDFHYFEVSWERDKGLIFTKKHQQISAPPSGISVKKTTPDVQIRAHQDNYTGFKYIRDSISGNLLISEFSDLYLYRNSKNPNLNLIEIGDKVLAVPGKHNDRKEYIYGVIDPDGKPLGELEFKYKQIMVIENLEGETDFLVTEIGENPMINYLVNNSGVRHKSFPEKYYANFFVSKNLNYPFYYQLSPHKNVLGFVWDKNEILDFLDYKAIPVKVPAGYAIRSWQPIDYLDLKESDGMDLRKHRENIELLLKVNDGPNIFYMNLDGIDYRPQAK